MDTDCPHCGTTLRLNLNLAGTTISCPRCGGKLVVPRPERKAAAPVPERTAPTPRKKREEPPAAPAGKRRPAPFTLWLLGVQATIALLGLSCLAGVFLREGWKPPEWSYFMENELVLVGAGIGLLLCGWAATYMPVLTSLGVATFVLCACAHHYVLAEGVDVSRVLALTVAMLGLWLALQHRRATAPPPGS